MKNKHATNYTSIIIAVLVGIILVFVALYAAGNTNGGSNVSESERTIIRTDKQPAPNFNLERLGGGTLELADYRGRKPVVLDFFATWCHNCQRDMPHLSELYNKYQDQVEVIGINLQENPSTIQKFVDKKSISFPIVMDTDGSVSRQYGVRYTNFHVLIDIDGNVIGAVPGDVSESDIIELIN